MVNITAMLYDEFGKNVLAVSFSVVIDGNTYNAQVIDGNATFEDVKLTFADVGRSAAGEYTADVVDGKAVFKKVVLSNSGIYEGHLAYLENANYNPSYSTMKITVLKVSVNISAEAASGKSGETVDITVRVTSEDGSTFNGTVNVKLPDRTTKQATITNGVGVVPWTIPDDIEAGMYDIQVIFEGDDYYDSGNASATVDVLKKNETNTTPENKVIPQGIAKHETGNPIYALLVMLIVIGLMPLRRK